MLSTLFLPTARTDKGPNLRYISRYMSLHRIITTASNQNWLPWLSLTLNCPLRKYKQLRGCPLTLRRFLYCFLNEIWDSKKHYVPFQLVKAARNLLDWQDPQKPWPFWVLSSQNSIVSGKRERQKRKFIWLQTCLIIYWNKS